MPLYTYPLIDLPRHAIRLVRLRRGYYTDPICCERFETFLHEVEGVPFEALSYTWSDASDRVEIAVNELGDACLVTRNLHSSLPPEV